MKMFKIVKILLFISGLYILNFSCNRPKKAKNYFNSEFYSILNYVTDSVFKDAAAISSRTLSVIKPFQKPSEKIIDSAKVADFPPFNVIQYNWLSIYPFALRNSLNKEDVNFMYDSIDPTKTILIDSNCVKLPVISEKGFLSFFQDSGINVGYDRIKRKYGTRSYISVSTPVFNSDYSKAIISFSYLCGPLCGNGYEFILKKMKGKWTIVDKTITWRS